jgi:hypothetical protein
MLARAKHGQNPVTLAVTCMLECNTISPSAHSWRHHCSVLKDQCANRKFSFLVLTYSAPTAWTAYEYLCATNKENVTLIVKTFTYAMPYFFGADRTNDRYKSV